jgi:hypothetical protein
MLTKTGFGAIKQGGVALYAGRWLDPATGRVRILPKAQSKFVNPLSYNQKMNYFKSRLLNIWNNLVE